MVSRLPVSMSTRLPRRAAASAASHPAWPAPTTMTSHWLGCEKLTGPRASSDGAWMSTVAADGAMVQHHLVEPDVDGMGLQAEEVGAIAELGRHPQRLRTVDDHRSRPGSAPAFQHQLD